MRKNKDISGCVSESDLVSGLALYNQDMLGLDRNVENLSDLVFDSENICNPLREAKEMCRSGNS